MCPIQKIPQNKDDSLVFKQNGGHFEIQDGRLTFITLVDTRELPVPGNIGKYSTLVSSDALELNLCLKLHIPKKL